MVHVKDLDVGGKMLKMLLKRGFNKLDGTLCRPTGSSRLVIGTSEVSLVSTGKKFRGL